MELISICAERMSPAPFPSEKTKAKVSLNPLPVFGVTETGSGGDAACPLLETVQVPCADQPLTWVAFCTSMYTFFAPVNPAVKVNARLNVSVFPDADTDDAPAFTEHWLFCSVPALPIVSGPCQAPASVAR